MTALQPWYQWDGQDLLLSVHIQPRARRNEIIGLHGDHLKICITAPPVDNKANDHLVKFLARAFDVAPRDIQVVAGAKGREKRLRIQNPRRLPINIPARDSL